MTELVLLPGDILIEKVNGSFGIVTKIFTSNKYQHAAAIWHDTSKVIEDWVHGVAITQQHMDGRYKEIWRPNCSDEIKKRSLDRIALRLGEPYGVQSLVAEGAYLDWGVTIPHGNGMYCSELICWGFAPEFELVPGVPPERTSPQLLRDSGRMTRVY